MSKSYIRYANDLFKQTMIEWDRKTLLETVLDKPTIPHYMSVFKYTPEQMEQYLKTKSAAGMSGHATNSIIFDFDDKLNVEAALIDTRNMYLLLEELGYQKNDIQIYFSGHKGFHLVIDLEQQLEQSQLKNFVNNLRSKGTFNSFDTKVYDVQRMFRAPFSLNKSTGLFKTPISKHQLFNASLDEIKEQSKNILDSSINIVESYNYSAPLLGGKELLEPPVPVKPPKIAEIEIIGEDRPDFTQKTKELTEAKYALQMGFFEDGERNEAFEILAATYKYLGYPKEFAHRMLKATDELYVKRMQNKGIHKELKPKKAIWTENINHVYGPLYKGGTYSEKDNELLQKTIQRYNLKSKTDENHIITVSSLENVFKKFATEIDNNTIKLGFKEIDDTIQITTSMLVYLLAAPSAGKSSITFSILNHASRHNLKTMFFSLDMGAPLVYQRLLQKHTGMGSKSLFKMYTENDTAKIKEFNETVYKNYGNVKFCFRSGLTVDDIENYIKKEKEQTGEYPKLIAIDYLECVTGPFSDPTANSGYVANRLKDLANTYECTVLLLVQPQKQTGDPSAELLSMRNVKGSSILEQAASIILTLSRPGFNPKQPEMDKFASISVVKNRMGQLKSWDFAWNGLTGEISPLLDEEILELKELREKKQAEDQKKYDF